MSIQLSKPADLKSYPVALFIPTLFSLNCFFCPCAVADDELKPAMQLDGKGVQPQQASETSNNSAKSSSKKKTNAFALPKLLKTRDSAETMTGRIKINDLAPDVALPDQNGKTISLSDFRGKKVVVFYFYPKDNTSVCTSEACSFRDSFEEFKKLGAEVIGVSSDTVESHAKFAEKNRLQFTLLADTNNMARKAFGVPNTAAFLPGRVTYVIDKNGVVRFIFNSMLDGSKHVDEAMKIVKDLNSEKPAT